MKRTAPGVTSRAFEANLLEAARRRNLSGNSLAAYERTWTRFLAWAAAASILGLAVPAAGDSHHGNSPLQVASTSMVQLTLILNYTALFIGCSLLDPKVRRLLDISAKMRPNHSYYFFVLDVCYRKEPKWYEEDYATAFRAVQDSLLKRLGVQPIWVDRYNEIGPAVRRLRA